MITIKDYAKETGVTYEAVRQRLKRYQEELEGHVHRQGRTQYLDDVAVAFLNEHRLIQPTVVYDKAVGEEYRSQMQELEDLRRENKALLSEIKTLQQFKIETMENRQQLEDARTAQERRERELDQREADMAEEVRMAVQEATDAQKTVLDELRAQEVAEVRQEAQEARQKLVKAHAAFEEDLRKKNEQIEAWEKYASALKEYEAMSKWQRWRKKATKPVPPAPVELQEDQE